MNRFAFASSGILRLALPVLSGLVPLALSAGPSPAKTPTLLTPQRAAGAVVEIIEPAVTVRETRHYQAKIEPSCTEMACFGDLPTLTAKRQLNLTRVTCSLLGTASSTSSGGYIELQTSDNSWLLDQLLPVDHAVPDERLGTYHTLNHAIDMQVRPGQHARIGLFMASGTAKFALCSVTGTLELLQ